ncbi:AAA family ATPase [Nannocystis sp. SCPEA4]|uniref:AAA family ATPase n=1 Tax=Nannocystis sp. SCPEA4 TaxID=2996787 RepID=UPI00226FA2A4|nr:AAA family ATPase [Nannocystis sp. SCPEA4]MCY1059739.1 AAA family ATPase [Nannocystis sp. SCPEA4]
MTSPSPYTITKSLSHGGRAVVYRAIRNADGCPVVIKVLDPRRRRPQDLEQLKHEYEIGTRLASPAVVKPLALETYEGMPALVLEDFGGEALDALLGTPMAVERFLSLAIGIARAVADVHRQDVVHRDLKPANILVNPATSEVKLADFGLASRLPREQQPVRLIEGSLPYLSPEQTGRMNRAIDNRADLYSLGVTFFQMLTGELPFAARDPLEWVHCHVARAPPSPAELVPEVPEALTRIVLKLLAKMPEERYQSAGGLSADLERCRAQWQACGRIEPFPLGRDDVSDRLLIPHRLYGRERETAALLAAFDAVAATGASALVTVSGYSGVGKSALVNALHKPIVERRGYFIAGKFDQYKRDIPYATLAQAFQGLVRQILGESEARIGRWRDALREALGPNGQLMVNLVPELELVIGPQPEVEELPPQEAQHRFQMVFRRLIGVFARAAHPLVLFLDDLQWLDAGTLALLADLATHPDVHHLLLVGAYRDNEVDRNHPLTRSLEAIRQAGGMVREIVLTPLALEDVERLVADALHGPPERARPLSQLVFEKTGGNPFFTIQFLTTLAEEKLLRFDPGIGAWSWDLPRIHAKGYTDNVVDLMLAKLARLPEDTQDVLKQFACLGNTVDFRTLGLVLERPAEAIHAAIWAAVRAGLVFRQDEGYIFLHDRVQEAAYSLIPEASRAETHLRIGRILASRLMPDEIAEKIFDVVNQLNRGSDLVESQEERERIAELNLMAGKRARRATAYASALTYLAAGAALLPQDCWERLYGLTFALELHRAECEFLTGALEAAEQRLAMLWGRAESVVDLAAVTCVRLDVYMNLDRSDRAVAVALDYLRHMGVDWSPHPTEEEARREYEQIWSRLGRRAIEELIDLPLMTDPASLATLDVLTKVASPAILTDVRLFALVACRAVNLSLERGNSDGSCLAYPNVGMVAGPLFGHSAAGFRFGQLGYELVERRGLKRFQPRIYMVFGTMIMPWMRHIRAGRDLARRAFETANETGDVTFAAFTCYQLNSLRLTAGDPLAEVQREAEDGLEFVQKARFGFASDIVTTQLQFVRMLRGATPTFGSFDDGQFDELRFERHLASNPVLAQAECRYWIEKLQARFLAGDHRAALAAASQAQRLIWTLPSFIETADYHFYDALSRAAACAAPAAGQRQQHGEALAAHHEQLELWAQNCPENFADRAALVGAEIARISGRDLEAMQLYERAIRSAHDTGFVQNEALANELAGRFYLDRGLDRNGFAHLRDARAGYALWGADGKVQQLDRQHPGLFEPRTLAPTATVAVRPVELDLWSVTKASQTISSEIVLDKLVRTLLSIVLEQGGAQRACLVLCRGESLSIEAEATLEPRGVVTTVLEPGPVDGSQRIPASVVHYAHRTKERVILSDAAADADKLAGDDYFDRHRPKSILCLPILRQAEVVGLLYLENNLLAGAFTPDRLVALSLCATQAAISLENALLLQRAAFLAEAGKILSASLDYEQTLDRLVRLCVRSFCDFCVIDIVEAGAIHRVSGAHKDPAKERLLVELRRQYPPRWDSPHPAAMVLRTGAPLLFPRLPDEHMRTITVDDEHKRLLRELGAQSSMMVPLVARGQTLGVLSIISTVPGRYGRADLELAQEAATRAATAIDNARLYRASQEAVRARSEFLTVASHELHTPMTSLMLALESLRRATLAGRPFDPQSVDRLVELAERQGARMTRLTNDLLDVSRMEAGPLPLELTDVDLVALVREVAERFEMDLARARCPLSIDSGAPVVGRWDRSRIDRVVTNLLANAIKFGAGEPIELFVRGEGGVGRLAVRDHGIGIAPEQRERIFGRFERAVSEKHYGGLGLGLYISRKLVEAHGGSIRCDSVPGAGTTFIVELPLSVARERP